MYFLGRYSKLTWFRSSYLYEMRNRLEAFLENQQDTHKESISNRIRHLNKIQITNSPPLFLYMYKKSLK